MERVFNDILLECKFAECQTNFNPFLRAMLEESQGIPSQLDDMLDAILSSKFLEKSYNLFKAETASIPTACKFDMYPAVKDVKRNFIGPKSYLSLVFKNSQYGSPQVGGYYDCGHTVWNREENYIENASVHFDCEVNKATPFAKFVRELRINLAHELLHAYEDYNRMVLDRPSLGQTLSNRHYPSIEDQDDFLEWFAYVLDPAEQKAFITTAIEDVQETIKEMKKAGIIDRFENIRNIDKILEHTKFWNNYSFIRDAIEEFQWNRQPEWRQKAIVRKYNSLVKGDVTSPFNRPINTYNQFLKKFFSRWKKFDNTLRVKIGQTVVRELYNENPKDPAFTQRNKLSESIIYQAF